MNRNFFLTVVGLFTSLNAGWGPVENVTPPGSDTQGIGVVSDLAGNAIVIVKNNAETPLQATSHPHSGIWQIYPDNLSAPFANADDADVAVDVRGHAIAVWTKVMMGQRLVQVSEKPFGENWTVPETLSELSSLNPRVVISPSGEVTVTWLQSIDNLDANFYAERVSGIWSPPLPIPGALSVSVSPKMVIDEKGNLAAIWIQSDGVYPRVVVSFKQNGLWQASPDFLSSAGLQAGHPNLAVDPQGNVTAAWISNKSLYASSKGFGLDWEKPVVLSRKGIVAEVPIILVDKSGNVTAIWESISGKPSIETSHKPFGASWQSVKTIASNSKTVRAAIDVEGNITAAWIVDNSHLEAKVKLAGEDWPLFAEKVTQGKAKGAPNFNHLVAVGTAGTQTIIWDNPALGNIQSSSFFFPDKPSIAYLSRASGLPEGGNEILITGASFEAVKDVTFNQISTPRFVVHSPNSITAIVPPGVAGSRVKVQVVTAMGVSVGASYTYIEPAPKPDPKPEPKPEPPAKEEKIVSVKPPCKLSGHQEKVRFVTQTETINIVSWNPPASGPKPVAYHIFRDKALRQHVATLKAHENLIFYDRNRLKDNTYTYYIVSEDEKGNLSSPASLTL